jgi:hypothetical protein
MQLYGVEYAMQTKKSQEKCKKTCLEKYGVSTPLKSKECVEKGKQTCKKHFGVENCSQSSEIKKRKEETCIKHFGVKCGWNTEKTKQTRLERYGVEYTHQNKDILEKCLKTSLKLKQFRDTKLWYQGSYELNFLEKYYDLFSDIVRGYNIDYIFKDENKVYHPDFFIPSLKLNLEIKSLYYYNKNKELCDAKTNAASSLEYKYIMIIDKDYTEFEKYIKIMH